MNFVALLRGINVGGNNMIKMADMKTSLERDGFEEVRTYIQSGNILFSSNETDTVKLAKKIEKHILQEYGHTVPVVVIDELGIKKIVTSVPKGWGEDPLWKYNTLFLIPPYDIQEAVRSIGELKPEIETLIPVEGALHLSVELKSFGRSQTSKMISLPIYKQVTIRNWNTTRKLLELMTKK